MVISDLNLICVNQQMPSIKNFEGVGFEYINMNKRHYGFYGKKHGDAYGNNWTLLNAFKGVWYSLVPNDDLTTIRSDTAFFDMRYEPNGKKFYAVPQEKFSDVLNDVFDYYVRQSPNQCICVLFRLDYTNRNKIKAYNLKQFKNLFKSGKLQFETIYVVFK